MPFSLITLVSLVLLSAALPFSAHALDCGNPPPVQNEELEGDIQGQARLLSRFLGDASLGGYVQTARTEIFSRYPDAEQSRSNAYFEYQVCVLLRDDPTLTTREKIDILREIRREFAKPAASSSPTTGITSANTGTKILLGLLLEVYLIEDNNKYPEQPTGSSLATFIDERPPSFGYDAVLAARELEPYRDHRLGLHWSGSFRITENGRHLFGSVVNQGRKWARCRIVLMLGGEQLFNGEERFKDDTAPFNQEVSLEQGIYPFECWMICDRLETSMQLRMRGPRDRIISLVPSDRFSHSP